MEFVIPTSMGFENVIVFVKLVEQVVVNGLKGIEVVFPNVVANQEINNWKYLRGIKLVVVEIQQEIYSFVLKFTGFC